MAWQFVGVSNVVEVTATSHALVTTGIAGTLQAGDLLVACISSRIASTTSVTLPTGGEWTLVSEQKNNNTLTTGNAAASGLMAYCVRGSSNPNLTFTHPTAPSVALGRIVAYRNVNQSSPKDTQTSFTTAVSTTAVSGTGLTTTQAGDLIVAMAAGGQEATWSVFDAVTDPATASGATNVLTAPTAGTWIERADSATVTGADTSLAIFDAIKSAAGATGNLTATASVSAAHVVIAGAFKIAVSTADAWDVHDRTAFNLSDSDKTATSTSTDCGVHSTTDHLNASAGKYYAEFLITETTGLGLSRGVGIHQASSAVIGTAFLAIYVDGSGSIFNASPGGALGTIVDGDVICVAWDAGAQRIWFRRNSGNWNNSGTANPATGAGGLDISAAADVDHALWASSNASGTIVTLRTELADFTLTVPSGFTSWMGESPPTTGTGTPAAQASDTDGVGISSSSGTGTPASQASAVAGVGTVASAGVSGDGALVAQSSAAAGVGVSTSIGTGTPTADSAALSGAGLSASSGTGTLADGAATLAANGASASSGTAALADDAATLAAIGISASSGSGALASDAATLSGAGTGESIATGTLVAGTVSLAGLGLSSSTGTGDLAADAATTSGAGIVEDVTEDITGIGALAAQAATASGSGISASAGTGALSAGIATVSGAGLSSSSGTGALDCSPVTVEGVGVVLEEGATIGTGALVAGAATISGEGEVTGEVAPPVTEGSGGYHYRPRRKPLPVVGYGYGILPQIEGEAHGVVGTVGRSIGALPRFAGLADAAAGAAGSSMARLTIKVAMRGVAGARGNGSGMIVKFEGAAVGRHDDDEAAIVAWLLAA